MAILLFIVPGPLLYTLGVILGFRGRMYASLLVLRLRMLGLTLLYLGIAGWSVVMALTGRTGGWAWAFVGLFVLFAALRVVAWNDLEARYRRQSAER